MVWTDQILTSMKWYVDGNITATGSMNYTWTAAAGGHTISFEGSNANGNVSKVWNIGATGSGNVSFAIEDVNQDGVINKVDLDSIMTSIVLYIPCPRCDINYDVEVDVRDMVLVAKKISG